MNKKKLVYVGLLLPLVCSAQQEDSDAPELMHQEDEQELVAVQEPESFNQEEADVAEDDGGYEAGDDQDEASQDAELDIAEPAYARGNWYEKQKTYIMAHDVYQEVRQKEAVVDQFEPVFVAKKNELTNRFEEFVQSLPVAQHLIYQALVDELEKLEHLAKPSPAMTQDERVKLTEAQETKNLLTQLKKDFDTITELYKAGDQDNGRSYATDNCYT